MLKVVMIAKEKLQNVEKKRVEKAREKKSKKEQRKEKSSEFLSLYMRL